jgi:hypothetical protein
MEIRNEPTELEDATTKAGPAGDSGGATETTAAAEPTVESEPAAETVTERSAESGLSAEAGLSAEPTSSMPAGPAESDGWPHCPWCSSPTPPGAQACPSCQAALVAYPEDQGIGIPGVTEIDPSLRDYKPGPRKPQKLADLLIKLLEPEALGEPESPAATPDHEEKSGSTGEPSDAPVDSNSAE